MRAGGVRGRQGGARLHACDCLAVTCPCYMPPPLCLIARTHIAGGGMLAIVNKSAVAAGVGSGEPPSTAAGARAAKEGRREDDRGEGEQGLLTPSHAAWC